jgi:2-polyprenyl-3-methyl-5-hydroxy-6-metoxy-1,4-benzoquinol methylase
LITYASCPVCASVQLQQKLRATDFTVSKEQFEIWECSNCTLRFTQAVPPIEKIGAYYKSDEYVSHTNTKKGLVNQLYHVIRKHTLRQKLRLVQRFCSLQTGSILDVGAGTGAFVHTMSKAGWKATGLEPDATTRQLAFQLQGTELQPIGELFKLPAETYDAITLWHVLEHVHALHSYLDQLKRLIKPNGKIIVAVPNYTSYDAAAYGSNWAAYDVPRHLYHFSPRSMAMLVEAGGATIETIKPMWFDSFYVSMLSEQYKTGKSNLLRACYIGLVSNLKAFLNTKKCSSLIYIIRK